MGSIAGGLLGGAVGAVVGVVGFGPNRPAFVVTVVASFGIGAAIGLLVGTGSS